MTEIHWNPSQRDLAWFGGLLPAFAALVGWTWYRRTGDPVLPAIFLGVAVGLALSGFIAPRILRTVYVGWMIAAFPISWVVSHLILGLVFYLAVTPWGLFMRLCGRDPLKRKFDATAASYWTQREANRPASSYFQQF